MRHFAILAAFLALAGCGSAAVGAGGAFLGHADRIAGEIAHDAVCYDLVTATTDEQRYWAIRDLRALGIAQCLDKSGNVVAEVPAG